MDVQNLREFIQDLFTLRTVWIDQGQGHWKVRKRLHPLLRGICWTFAVILCAVMYAGFSSARHAEVATAFSSARYDTVADSSSAQYAGMALSPEHSDFVTAPSSTRNDGSFMAASSARHNYPLTAQAPSALHTASQPEDTPQTILLPLRTVARLPELELPSPETDTIITEPEKVFRSDNDQYHIFVNKSAYTLSLFRGSELVKTYPIAVGKNPGDKQRVGDNRTPTGDFHIISIENASGWKHDFRDGKGKIAGAYGPWFLRLDAKGWKGIGIHGTHDPDSRGTNATEGCIRLSNEDISELKQYAYRNMPVVITED